MNREEAINVIKGARKYLTVGNPIWNVKKVDEAFDMAIEALTEPINCVKCEHYYETEDDTDVHGNCRMVEVVRCKDCIYKCLYDEGETKYYYCALEDRPNRNWSVDDTDYCSWGERRSDE